MLEMLMNALERPIKKLGLARKDAANALLEQEELQNANLKLQEQILLMGWRANLLVGERQANLVKSLTPFAGQKVNIHRSTILGSANGVPAPGALQTFDEQDALVKAIVRVLSDAHWVPEAPVASGLARGQGINVQVLPNAPLATRRAFAALRKAITAVPLAVSGPEPISDDAAKQFEATTSPGSDVIFLIVQPK